MEQDAPEQQNPQPQAPSPEKKQYARPKLSEDRLKDADGKAPVKRDYGSKAQWVFTGIFAVLCLVVYVMSHLHRKPVKPKEPVAAHQVIPAPPSGILIPGAGPPLSSP